MSGVLTRPITRRLMLTRAAQLGALGAAAPLAMNLAAIGEAAAAQTRDEEDYKALVCIFLAGGNDHANTLVPWDVANYGRYLNIRGAISYRHEDLTPTLLSPRVPQALTDHLQYAFAPQLPRFKVLFDGGKMAVQLNVGPLVVPLTRAQYESSNRALYPLPPKLFSHNDQQSVWQADGSEGATVGWGGRFGDLALAGNGHALLTCISAAGNAVFVSGEQALQYQISPLGAIPVKPMKEPLYASGAIGEALRQLITEPRPHHHFENALAIVARRSIEMEGVVNGALAGVSLNTSFDLVPGENELADQMKIVARLIAARRALGSRRQVFFVSLGGFDTHSDLAVKHAELLTKVDEAVAAFYMATVELGVADRVTAFTASDFGRTLVNNGDGSDHGWGGHHFVIGGAVRGGRFYGTAPHVSIESDDQVGQGRLLPSTASDQYAATLARWFGVGDDALRTILPNIGNFDRANLGFV